MRTGGPYLNEHSGLVVRVGGEDLLLLGGDGGVPGDQDGHDTASSLQTQGQGGDIEQQQVLDLLVALTAEDSGLDGGTIGDSLVGVDALAQLLAVEEVLEQLLDLGDTGGATDQDDLVHLGLVHFGVPQALLHRVHALPADTNQVGQNKNLRKGQRKSQRGNESHKQKLSIERGSFQMRVRNDFHKEVVVTLNKKMLGETETKAQVNDTHRQNLTELDWIGSPTPGAGKNW